MRPRKTKITLPAAMAIAAIFLSGCNHTQIVDISSTPVPALISIDGAPRGNTPLLHQELIYSSSRTSHQITAIAKGYKDQSIDLDRKHASPSLAITLKPQSRRVTFLVSPFSAALSIDGAPISPGLVRSQTIDLIFKLDDQDHWIAHKLLAARPGFQPIERTVNFTDRDSIYAINLEPMRKDVSIHTNPPGAAVRLDDQELGATPLVKKSLPFSIDPQSQQWNEYHLHITKPGYDPLNTQLQWDDGRADYTYDLPIKHKTIHIVTNPPGAVLRIDGAEIPHTATGPAEVTLQFPPIADGEELRTHEANIFKKTADTDWEPAKLVIGWDDGKTDYTVTLKEIKTIAVPLLSAEPTRSSDGWQMVARETATLAMRRDVSERSSHSQPTKLTHLPRGTMIDSLAISPDGLRLIFTVLQSDSENAAHADTRPTSLRSQMHVIRTDGAGGLDDIGDGKSLDIQPTFSPDGKQIVFSSNRAGRRQSIWSMSAAGTPGITQLTSGDSNDLWPVIDPARRLFYQAMVDTRSDPRLFMCELGKTTRTDLTELGGSQPRVSPDATPETGSILFASVNEKTGKRNIFRMPIKSGVPENLTNTPDVDDYDPAWSPDASRMAYVSNAGSDEDHRHYYSIWIMNLSDGENHQPAQITANGSQDDRPVWDPGGNALYFRSNRGGEWAIWKISLK